MPALFSNSATATLASSITSTATSIAVAGGFGSLFPSLSGSNYFWATLVDSSNNLEVVRVTARSGDVMTVVRGQDGTTARAYSSGSKFELRVTSAALGNFAQLDGATFTGSVGLSGGGSMAGTFSGNPTFSGNVTFSNTIAGSVSGNAGTVTNGVYTNNTQTISGEKTFSSTVTGRSAGSTSASFSATTTGGAFGLMWNRRGALSTSVVHTGSSYAPSVTMVYEYTGAYSGVYSMGHLTTNEASPGALAIHHINSSGVAESNWLFYGADGKFVSTGDVTAFSDERLKTNWRSLRSDFIEALARVRAGVYDRTDVKATQVGVSAQSLWPVMPEAVSTDGNGTMSVAYGNAALTACVELAKAIVSLRQEVAGMKGA